MNTVFAWFSAFVTGCCLGLILLLIIFTIQSWLSGRRTLKLVAQIKPMQWIPLSATDPSEPKPEKGWRAPPVDSTLGWRGWNWNPHEKCLQSPAYHALWRDGECRVEQWDKGDAVRGVAGIHALWPVPKDWQNKDGNFGSFPVVGIVERYGHYVLGEDGWRAEWVIVRELAAHKSILEEVRKAYLGITVHERVCSDSRMERLMRPGIQAWQQHAAQSMANQMQNTTAMSAQQALGYVVLGGSGAGGSGYSYMQWADDIDTPPGCIGDPTEMP